MVPPPARISEAGKATVDTEGVSLPQPRSPSQMVVTEQRTSPKEIGETQLGQEDDRG